MMNWFNILCVINRIGFMNVSGSIRKIILKEILNDRFKDNLHQDDIPLSKAKIKDFTIDLSGRLCNNPIRWRDRAETYEGDPRIKKNMIKLSEFYSDIGEGGKVGSLRMHTDLHCYNITIDIRTGRIVCSFITEPRISRSNPDYLPDGVI